MQDATPSQHRWQQQSTPAGRSQPTRTPLSSDPAKPQQSTATHSERPESSLASPMPSTEMLRRGRAPSPLAAARPRSPPPSSVD
eukprot:1927590-Rhodomonas_salina.1